MYAVVLFAAILFISLVVTALLLHRYVPLTTGEVKSASIYRAPEVTTKSVGPPVRLNIANINVDTLVQPVGLTSEGDMATGSNVNEVSWYQLGPKPGEKGSAVIAGHYGGKIGGDLVFHDLHTLSIGDVISVYDDMNSVMTFSVQKIRSYGSEDSAAEVFVSNDGKAHLNLITCSGVWDASTKMYSERLVVFTDQVTN